MSFNIITLPALIKDTLEQQPHQKNYQKQVCFIEFCTIAYSKVRRNQSKLYHRARLKKYFLNRSRVLYWRGYGRQNLKTYLENARLIIAPFSVPNVFIFQHFGNDGLTRTIEPQLTMRFHLRFQPKKRKCFQKMVSCC